MNISLQEIEQEIARLRQQEERGRVVYFNIKAIISLSMPLEENPLAKEEQNYKAINIHNLLKPISDLILVGDFKLALYLLEKANFNIYCPKELIDFITNTIKTEIGIE